MQNSQDTSASLLLLLPLLMSSCSAELGKFVGALMQAQKKFDPSEGDRGRAGVYHALFR